MTKKTLMPEVLPAPPAAAPPATVRARAQQRLETLAKRAALAGAAGSLSACLGYCVVDLLPEPAVCSPGADLDQLLSANATVLGADLNLVLTLRGQLSGVTLSTEAVAEGATVDGELGFDGADLASSTTVTIPLLVDDGATEVIVHTGVSCGGAPRAVDVHVDVATLAVTLVDPG